MEQAFTLRAAGNKHDFYLTYYCNNCLIVAHKLIFLFHVLRGIRVRKFGVSMLLAGTMLAASPMAQAQGHESAELRAEMEMLRAQMANLQARIDAMDSAKTGEDAGSVAAETAPLRSSASIAQPAPASPQPQIAVASTPENPENKVKWRGAPEISNENGFSFKPRGRVQWDVASSNTPAGVGEDSGGGLRTEFRRVYLGVDGKLPGGFGYRVEADIADGVSLTDVYLSYSTGPVTITAGQVKPFWGLDEMTSDLFISQLERSSISQAFGFERRVGLSAQYVGKELLLQGGIFGANADDLNDHSNKSFAMDGRAIWMPKLGDDVQLHLGGSLHMRNLNQDDGEIRYRARPGAHTTNLRLVDTGNLAARGERSVGLEAALIKGPFHATAEGYWQKVRRMDGPNPTFFGGYAEVGMVLTKGDKRSYKAGAYDRLSPSNPIHEGGMGAFEINARYDYLDLNDKDIIGGTQKAAWLSLVWVPIDYVRFTANYGKLWINDAAIAAPNGDRKYSADSFGLRTQLDF